jgi:hypothetical protein
MRAVPAVLVIVHLSACWSCASEQAASVADGGLTGRGDATVDGASDAKLDAGDAPTVETGSGFDAGFDPFVGTWTAIPGAPSTCDVKVAADPATSIGAMQWDPCPSGPPGCQKLRVTWTVEPGRSLDVFGNEPVRLVGTVPYIHFRRLFTQKL